MPVSFYSLKTLLFFWMYLSSSYSGLDSSMVSSDAFSIGGPMKHTLICYSIPQRCSDVQSVRASHFTGHRAITMWLWLLLGSRSKAEIAFFACTKGWGNSREQWLTWRKCRKSPQGSVLVIIRTKAFHDNNAKHTTIWSLMIFTFKSSAA